MGSCISKCMPKTQSEVDAYENDHVQDKLVVISSLLQGPPTTSPVSVLHDHDDHMMIIKVKPPSSSPSHSTSSFSCNTTTTSTTSSASSCSSSSSSTLSCSKIDRSFSNEFLWSCAKENPHVLCSDPIKESPLKYSVSGTKFHAPKLLPPEKSPVIMPPPPPPQRNIVGVGSSTPQKRVRSSSPVLVRQKSLRREPERPPNSLPSRTLRSSPSPSRRFELGHKCRGMMLPPPLPLEITSTNSVSKRPSSTSPQRSPSSIHPSPSPVRKGAPGNLRPPSPKNKSSRQQPSLRNREMGSHAVKVGPKIGEIGVGKVLSNLGIDSLPMPMPMPMPMEDINNPLISLDCFIFL